MHTGEAAELSALASHVISPGALFISKGEKNMSNHTPGPWRTARRGNGSQELPILRSDGKEIGCIRGEARLGDARLIAAAPDLLEACKALSELKPLVKHHHILVCSFCGCDLRPDPLGRIRLADSCPVCLARAAIAKAEEPGERTKR